LSVSVCLSSLLVTCLGWSVSFAEAWLCPVDVLPKSRIHLFEVFHIFLLTSSADDVRNNHARPLHRAKSGVGFKAVLRDLVLEDMLLTPDYIPHQRMRH
jgi:hypothetical protein